MLRVFRGFFLVAYGKKSLEEILFKMLLRKKYNHHRNLDGIYTDVFGVAYGKKSLEEILFKILPTARNILRK